MSNLFQFAAALIPILAVVIVIIFIVAGKIYQIKLKKGGKTVDREDGFWEYEQRYTTSVSHEDFEKAIAKKSSTIPAMIKVDADNNRIVFKSGIDNWTAIITYNAIKEGKNLFSFCFAYYEKKENVVCGTHSMNVVMTSLEDIFLSMDPQMTVDKKKLNFHKIEGLQLYSIFDDDANYATPRTTEELTEWFKNKNLL